MIAGTIQAPRSSPSEIPIESSHEDGRWSNSTWLDDSVAYAPQQPYVRHGTVRNNITYGHPFWQSRYQEVLRQSSLLPDLANLADGDETEIGERGINLSGGQKARINLARCLYSRARTIYMDDVLSAVDAHTARHIADEALAGCFVQGRTVVLVTHQENLCMPLAGFVITLSAGILTAASAITGKRSGDLLSEEKGSDPTLTTPHKHDPTNGDEDKRQESERDVVKTSAKVKRIIYDDEHMDRGAVTLTTYIFVLGAAGGTLYWVILGFCYGAERVSDIAMSVWLRHWSSDPDRSDLDLNLAIYGVLLTANTTVYALMLVWQYGVFRMGFINGAARKVHEGLVDRIFSARLMFFESVPSSRLMNVFGRDMSILDQSAGQMFGGMSVLPREFDCN